MPPSTRRQQRFVFARARAGEAWAKRWVAEGKMDIVPRRKKRKRRRHG